jgi:hypothetical protein
MMQYEIAHRPSAGAASKRLAVDAKSTSAAITATRNHIPEGHAILFVRPLNADLRLREERHPWGAGVSHRGHEKRFARESSHCLTS